MLLQTYIESKRKYCFTLFHLSTAVTQLMQCNPIPYVCWKEFKCDRKDYMHITNVFFAHPHVPCLVVTILKIHSCVQL
jgi:hypothetical protein